MTTNFYRYANFCLGLGVVAGLFQNLIHFQLGEGIYKLHSLSNWLLLMNLISLATAFFLLSYYQYKQYRVALLTGIVATVMTFCGYLFLYLALQMRVLASYTTPVIGLVVSAGIVYSGSLVFSIANERPWLKWAGIFSFMMGFVQLATMIWFRDAPPMPVNTTLDTIRLWSSLFGTLLPVLFIVNFLSETPLPKENHKTTESLSRSEIIMGAVGLIAFCALVVGLSMAGESHEQTHVSYKAMQLAQPFDTGSYVGNQGDTMLYRLLKPLHYDPQKKYPLVVCLPYTCADDNIRQVEGCPPARWLSTLENRAKYPAFLFVPRCPPGSGWGGVPHTPAVDSLAIEAILSLDKTFSIDKERRYVTGVSRGGYGSWRFITTHPELFAAAIPVCGEGYPETAKNMAAVANVNVWAFHGANDQNVPVSGSRNMVAAIKKAGGKPRYTEYPDAAHSIWEDVEKTPGLSDWLFRQRRHE